MLGRGCGFSTVYLSGKRTNMAVASRRKRLIQGRLAFGGKPRLSPDRPVYLGALSQSMIDFQTEEDF